MLESGTYNKFRTGEKGKGSRVQHSAQGCLCGGTGVLMDCLVMGAHAVVKDDCTLGCLSLRCRWQQFLPSVQHS